MAPSGGFTTPSTRCCPPVSPATSGSSTSMSTRSPATADTWNSNTESDDRRAVEKLLPCTTSPVTPTPPTRRQRSIAPAGASVRAIGGESGGTVIDLTESSPAQRQSSVAGTSSGLTSRMARAFAATGPVRGETTTPAPRSEITTIGISNSSGNNLGWARFASSGVMGFGRLSLSPAATQAPPMATPITTTSPSTSASTSTPAIPTVAAGESTVKTEAGGSSTDDVCIVGVVKAETSSSSLNSSTTSTANLGAMGPPPPPNTTSAPSGRTGRSATPSVSRSATPATTSTAATTRASRASTPARRQSLLRVPAVRVRPVTATRFGAPSTLGRTATLAHIATHRRARSMTPYERAETNRAIYTGYAAALRRATAGTTAQSRGAGDGVSVVIPTSALPGGSEAARRRAAARRNAGKGTINIDVDSDEDVGEEDDLVLTNVHTAEEIERETQARNAARREQAAARRRPGRGAAQAAAATSTRTNGGVVYSNSISLSFRGDGTNVSRSFTLDSTVYATQFRVEALLQRLEDTVRRTFPPAPTSRSTAAAGGGGRRRYC